MLGDLCLIRSGYTQRDRLVDSVTAGILTIQQRDIDADGRYDVARAMRSTVPDYAARHVVRPGELVFRSRGPYWSAHLFADQGEPILAIAPLFILQPTPDIDPGYLAWCIGRPAAQEFLTSHAKGTGVQMITKPTLASLPLTPPSIGWQRMLAEVSALAREERELAARHATLRTRLIDHQLDAAAAPAAQLESNPTNRKHR